MTWLASPETDDDLIAARDFIAADNELAARDFLDAAFETFDRLAELSASLQLPSRAKRSTFPPSSARSRWVFPEMGPTAHFNHPDLKDVRYFVLPPPFNRWLIFYKPAPEGVDIRRVLYGNINWKQEPERFF